MHSSAISADQSSAPRPRARCRFRPLGADSDSPRLAFFRRGLTALLLLTGAPVLVLSPSVAPSAQSVRAVLALVCCAFLVLTARLLYLEWRHRQYLENLRALASERRVSGTVHTGEDGAD